MSNKVTYRQQHTRCGKERCRKCKEGAGHGPYWYAYWSEAGRTVSKYVGIQLPADVERDRQLTKKKELPFEAEQDASLAIHSPLFKDAAVTNKSNVEVEHKLPLHLPSQVLRIYVLGQFRVDRKQDNIWSPVVNRTWHRRRARALLGCLLSSAGRRQGREQVMEDLWPNLDMETAANRLNGAVHELRQILEPELARPSASSMLRLERDVLVLADRTSLWVDADAFESLLYEANHTSLVHKDEVVGAKGTRLVQTEEIERLLENASSLYMGDYLLEELYSEWAAPRREVLRRGWIGLLLKLSELHEGRGAYASAMEPLNRLLASDPTDETAVQRLMLLLTQLDRRGEALNTYRRLATRLERNFESEPLPETHELYEKLRQGQISKLVHAQIIPAYTEQTLDNERENKVTPSPGTSQLGRSNQSPLIGRSHELETMREVLLSIECTTQEPQPDSDTSSNARATYTKQTRVLLLMGEAGIGKTRLAEELSYEGYTRGWAVAWSRAYEQEGTVPYRPWIELLRTLLQNISAADLVSSIGTIDHKDKRASSDSATAVHYAPTALERLSTLLPELRDLLPKQEKNHPQLPPEQERLHLWEATLGLLSLLSKKTPLLLVLDDLHWTDGSSRELLAYITRHIQGQRILLLGTCRDVELSPNHGLRSLIADLRREQAIVTIAVQPLTRAQIGSLVAHLPQNIVQSIQKQAAGNPFFAEELARMIPEQPQAKSAVHEHHYTYLYTHPIEGHERGERKKSTTGSGLPESIAAVLERRLGRLSNECQVLLGKAAVLGGTFEFGQLLSMANEHNEDELLDLLEEALQAGLLTEEGMGARITYHFWHPLIVSHLYERLSAARCAQLHRRAASVLLNMYVGHEGDVAAAITYHLSKGGGETKQIALYAELAAHQAYTLAAFVEAEQYYWQAVKGITNGLLPTEDTVHDTSSRKGDGTSAVIRDPLHVARLLERVCECAFVQGNYEEARRTYQRILHLRNQPPPLTTDAERKQEAQLQGLLWREIGRTWAANGHFEQAYESYRQGEQVMRDAGVTSGAAWACILHAYGSIRTLQGSYDEARRYVLAALEMLNQVLSMRQEKSAEEDLRVKEQRHILAMGEPRRFQTRTEEALLGNPLEVGVAYESLGIIDANVGHFSEALKHLHKALAIFEQHDLAIAMVKVYGNLGAVHAVKSENNLALSYLHRALALAEQMGNLPIIAFVSGNLGEMATRSGNVVEAEQWFRRSLAMSEQINDPEQTCWVHVALAGSLQAQGNLVEAAKCIRRALTVARAMKSSRNIGGALIALADLRVTQASIAYKVPGDEEHISRKTMGYRLLRRAKATVQRALLRVGLETELLVEGQLIRANINFLLGTLETARGEAKQTMEEARQHELTRMYARSCCLLARILAAQGEYEQANSYFEQAMQIFRECEFRLDYARALHGYGDTLLERGKSGEYTYQQGMAYLREAGNIFADCHAAIDLEWVKAVLDSTQTKTIVQ